MHSIAVGRRALLVETEDTATALALAHWARQALPADLPVEEIVPGARTVLFDGVGDLAALQGRLEAWAPDEDLDGAGDLVEIPVRYDGPDLTRVAQQWGVDRDEAVARHAGVEYVSAFCGFAPGFAYLTGLPVELHVPRLDSPRARVPAGSVALAGEWCAVYPSASPGGWQILGTAEVTLWDASRDSPALLAPGTRVRFVPR